LSKEGKEAKPVHQSVAEITDILDKMEEDVLKDHVPLIEVI